MHTVDRDRADGQHGEWLREPPERNPPFSEGVFQSLLPELLKHDLQHP
jgi:hypothetical protein